MRSAVATSFLPLCLVVMLTTSVGATDVPASIKASGKIRVGVEPVYPPLEYRDPATGDLAGFDIDLGNAIAAKLGVKIDWQETVFQQLIPSLQTGRIDMILSGMIDLPKRQDGATFIDYKKSGPQFVALASRAAEFRDMQGLCGKTVAASRATAFPDDIATWSKDHCGANPITVIGANTSADARGQVQQGRADANVQGSETVAYSLDQQPGTFIAVGLAFGKPKLTGMGIAKDNVELQKAIASALDSLIADGTYVKLLSKYHFDADGIEKATINAGQ